MRTLQLPYPYLIFLGDLTESAYLKTAFGLRDWAPERCMGEYALAGATVTTGLPRMSPTEAKNRGARALIVGAAPVGGVLAESWITGLLEGLGAGLDLISGLHQRLSETPKLKRAAAHLGRQLIDVRSPPRDIPIATGRKRSGMRLLTVGTDCALGKKYTALAITRELAARRIPVDFRATGQTGIMISGAGIPIDAVIADFVAGAAEALSPDAPHDHWDVVEGQGSLYHPAYAGVSLGLLHGSQPDVIVLCHELGRQHVYGLPNFALPDLSDAIQMHISHARRTNPAVRCAGVSLNTAALSEAQARLELATHARNLGLPCADPLRGGPAFLALVDECLGPRA